MGPFLEAGVARGAFRQMNEEIIPEIQKGVRPVAPQGRGLGRDASIVLVGKDHGPNNT